jgi:hypothetical protein
LNSERLTPPSSILALPFFSAYQELSGNTWKYPETLGIFSGTPFDPGRQLGFVWQNPHSSAVHSFAFSVPLHSDSFLFDSSEISRNSPNHPESHPEFSGLAPIRTPHSPFETPPPLAKASFCV